jgi:serine/threonine protein kinase/tetratricopeptide (TPR) repeat protein
MEDLKSGSILADRYEIIEELGKGGMGQVYVAEDQRLKRRVAVKVLPADMLSSDESRKRFEREAKAVAALSHPNILAIHDFGEDRGAPYAVMELLDGGTLREILRESPLPPSAAMDYAKQIASGVAYAHEQGIIHRDLKPENIMITQEGRIKILDFGLAKNRFLEEGAQNATVSIAKTTEPGMIMGTLGYMSPEQVRSKDIDHRSDIFSFGAVFYEMISGRRAFSGESPADTMSAVLKEDPPRLTGKTRDLTPALESIIKRCLEKRREERFQSARDVLFALESVSTGDIEFQAADTSGLRDTKGTRAETISTTESAALFFRSWFSSPVRTIFTFAVPVILAVTLFLLLKPTSLLGFGERDWVLVTDFQIQEDQAELGKALSLALKVGLEESEYVNVVSKSRINSVLKLMQKPPETLVDEATGREICLRARIKGLIVPELNRVGGQYLLTLSLMAPTSGDTVASFAERAENEDGLLDSLESAIQDLRQGLGESLDSIQLQGKPLAAATTGSLEALQLYTRGSASWGEGQYKEAMEHFEEALKVDPDFAMVYAALGNSYASFVYRDMENAEKNFKEALARLDRVGPREEYMIPALYHGSLRRHEEAIRFYKLHLERYPDDLQALYNLGNMYRNIRDLDQAIASYQEVLRLNPQHASALINTATCLANMDQEEEAIRFYLRAFEVNPNWELQGNLNHEYGMTLIELDRLEEAQTVFEKRTSHTNANERGSAYRSLGQLELRRGRFDTAAGHFEQASLLHESLKAKASVARNQLWWAIGETARGKDAAALQMLDDSIGLVPLTGGWIWMHSLLGRAYVDAGGIEQAAGVLDTIKKWIAENENYNRDSLQRHDILEAEIQAARGQSGAALDALEALQAVQPNDNPFLVEALAEGFAREQRWDEAVDTFSRLIDMSWISYEGLVPWIQAHFQLAQALEKTGDTAKAVEYYERFLSLWKDTDSTIEEMGAAVKRLAELKEK